MWLLIIPIILLVSYGTAVVVDNSEENWNNFDALFKIYGQRYGVDWHWLKAIALNESDLGAAKSVAHGMAYPKDAEGSKSSDGKSWGLMQVTLTTAKGLDSSATTEKLNNPEYSIKLAAQYLGELKKMFSLVELRYSEWVIKSYNQGPGNTKKEKIGDSNGFAQGYWEKFKRNLKRVEENI